MDFPMLLFVTSLQAPPNGFTTCGQTVRPPAMTRLLHACELGPFPAETIEMAGAQAVGRPNTGSSSTAGAY